MSGAGEPAPARPALTPRRLFKMFKHQPGRRRMLVFEAVLWLAFSRVALIAVPFRVLAARFGKFTPASAPVQAVSNPSATDTQTALDVGWAVTRSARYVPFRAVCLPQAIAAKAMLQRRGVSSVMHFGVEKAPGNAPMLAHAWLDLGGIEVTGFPISPGMVEVARFE